ncbi:MAG: hypothetical protein ACTJHC_02720 [Vagococcus sp.]
MNEETSIKELLQGLCELSRASNIKVNGKLARVEDVQELYLEGLISVCELLGYEDI